MRPTGGAPIGLAAGCGSDAEVIGALAVVVSLIFVGEQIAQANDLARDAAEQKQIESMGRISFPPGSEL